MDSWPCPEAWLGHLAVERRSSHGTPSAQHPRIRLPGSPLQSPHLQGPSPHGRGGSILLPLSSPPAEGHWGAVVQHCTHSVLWEAGAQAPAHPGDAAFTGGSRTLCDSSESNPTARPRVMVLELDCCGPALPACRARRSQPPSGSASAKGEQTGVGGDAPSQVSLGEPPAHTSLSLPRVFSVPEPPCPLAGTFPPCVYSFYVIKPLRLKRIKRGA